MGCEVRRGFPEGMAQELRAKGWTGISWQDRGLENIPGRGKSMSKGPVARGRRMGTDQETPGEAGAG